MRVKSLHSQTERDAAHEAQAAYGAGAILHEHDGRYFALIAAGQSDGDDAGVAEPFTGDPTRTIAGVLRHHRIPPALAERLESAGDGIGDCEMALAVALGKVMRFCPMPRRVLAVGAPASGKTTLISKLASRPRREPVRISWMEGVDSTSLIAYAAALGLDAEPLTDSIVEPSEIALAEAPGLIASELRRGRTFDLDVALDAARTACLTPVLVLPAESGVAEAAELAAAAVEVGVEHLAITRLDQAKHMGAVLAATALGGLQLTTASINPHMSYGLRALTPAVLARLMLEEKGSGLRLHETADGDQTARAYLQSVY